MMVICSQNSTGLNSSNNHVIVGWMHQDEPDNDQNGAPCVDPSVIQSLYNQWTTTDPTRPIYLNFGQGVSYTQWGGRGACTGRTDMYPEYCKGADIVSFDIYPVVSDDPIIQGQLWYVPKGVDSLRMWSNYEKPVWVAIECTHIKSTVMPTPEQTKAEIWMAIIHGAMGINYFCHEWYPSFAEAAWLTRYPEMKAAITAINQEITELAPVLNSPTVYDVLETKTSWRNRLSTMVKVHGGYTYIFAVFKRDRSDTVQFNLTGLPSSATAEVLSEDRSIEVVNGRFTDSFEGYGLHLYKIDAPLKIEESSVVWQRKLFRTIKFYPQPLMEDLTFVFMPEIVNQKIKIEIFSLQGEKIVSLIKPQKQHWLKWDGKTSKGLVLPPGIYQLKIECQANIIWQKIIKL